MPTRHFSYYVNLSHLAAIAAGTYLGIRWLRVEEAKAGIQQRSMLEVITDDIGAARRWWNNNVAYRQYRHM